MERSKPSVWDFAFLDRGYTDLKPVICGYEACRPGHSAHVLRRYYLLHYVESGKGRFYSDNRIYEVGAGQAFLIRPQEAARYEADSADPWTYVWIGFEGALCEKLSSLPSPVFSLPATAFSMIRALENRPDTKEEAATSLLFSVYADIMAGRSNRPHYVRRVTDAIRSSYMTPLTVQSLANSVGLDRRYLCRLFRESVGMGIQEYLIQVRMEQAQALLRKNHSVALTAELVGYPDCFNFSKMFKKRYGISPREYAKRNGEE